MDKNLTKFGWFAIYGLALVEGIALLAAGTFASILAMPLIAGITVQTVAALSIILLAGMGLMNVLGMKK